MKLERLDSVWPSLNSEGYFCWGISTCRNWNEISNILIRISLADLWLRRPDEVRREVRPLRSSGTTWSRTILSQDIIRNHSSFPKSSPPPCRELFRRIAFPAILCHLMNQIGHQIGTQNMYSRCSSLVLYGIRAPIIGRTFPLMEANYPYSMKNRRWIPSWFFMA